MLLTNGRIYTLDAADCVVDTLVVRAGHIVFAGRRADVNVPAEHVIDLGGRAVLPGLVDAHGHLMYLARLRLVLDVAGLPSEEASAQRVAARAALARPGEWITVWNAYAAHQEAALGTLEPGKWADLVACSADVFTCPEAEIPAIEPVLTLVAGEIVLDRRIAS